MVKQYVLLTQFIPWLKEDVIQGWVFDEKNDGSPGHPKSAPYVRYGKIVDRFVDVLIEVTKETNPDKEYDFHEVLKNSGLTWQQSCLLKADVSDLSAETVIAMIHAIVASERFSDGTIGRFIKNGTMVRWLERLKELDEQNVEYIPEKELPQLI